MLKIGLTGSIAVGKSFVAQVLAELGAIVLDSDQTAREVVEPETEGWRKIVETFGTSILNSDQTLNRAKLGAEVFAGEEKRKLLNAIVHPLIFSTQEKWMAEIEKTNSKAIVVIDAALMIETGSYRRFDKIIVVWCKPEVQLERLMTRNNLNLEDARQRIRSQMSQEEKKGYADYLIDSSNGFEDTRRQVEKVYQSLLNLVG
jgi:dephospho-CoA kinase